MEKSFKLIIFTICFILMSIMPITTPAQETEASYRLGPGDALHIFVWKEPELTRDIIIMPDGKISFPMIGEVQAQGKSVTELKEVIAEKLSQYVTAPEVTVIVNESRSRRIYTIGKVSRPGPYPLLPDMTVLQALSTAGGLAEWADERNILIIRRGGNKEIQLKFNYREFISGQNIGQNILLQPSDTIVVP